MTETKGPTQEQLDDAMIPYHYRDRCAHLLLPLNQCRQNTYWLPWKCSDERHAYEKCQYVDYVRRMAKKMSGEADS